MGSLRSLMESDLSTLIEGDFGLPVQLISPDGVEQVYSVNDPESLLMGQVVYDHVRIPQRPIVGGVVYSSRVCVALRISSLLRVPQAREKWVVKIPSTPSEDGAMVSYVMTEAKRGGASGGYILLTLTRLKDAPETVPENPEVP